MAVLEGLEPRSVFRVFEEISKIPHGSGNTKAISDWCVAYAKERGLEVYQDSADNVIIISDATEGYEDAPAFILQGHIDMVCEKAADCTKDMDTEPIEIETDGKMIWAKGTTLGGDDGVAVAIALGILDDPSIPHPRLEVLLTSDEEIGLIGAVKLDPAPLQGKQLVNIDNGTEGIFTTSSAGACMTVCTVPIKREAFDGEVWKLRLTGMTGGHSGAEIHRGRANAIVLGVRLLKELDEKLETRIVTFNGGAKGNAIPSVCELTVSLKPLEGGKSVAAVLEKDIPALMEQLRAEFAETDPELNLACTKEQSALLPADASSTSRTLLAFASAPNGVQKMSEVIPGLVQTSLNLGVINTDANGISGIYCIRSSVNDEKDALNTMLQQIFDSVGGGIEITGPFPAWEYNANSELRQRMVRIFKDQYGREPELTATHGGLECGIFCGKIPGLDCVAIGADNLEAHTCRERLDIASTQRVWKFVLELLRQSR